MESVTEEEETSTTATAAAAANPKAISSILPKMPSSSSILLSPKMKANPQTLLPSNDDDLERARARALKSAAVRRKPFPPPPPSSSDLPDLIDREQLLELYRNCIKLAAENKINQKNTWELPLIDHLSEIIRVELEGEKDANFQKASCTLEAGVRIYSLRVDSVHAQAYKVLGGINRAGLEESGEHTPGCYSQADQQAHRSENKTDRKISPLSTLESSFEVLNIKKFDVAFSVDPLCHQTSAQFDEGGAKGLLLNNLGVYCGCLVLFDSFEVPEKNIAYAAPENKSVMIDLSFANEQIEPMVIHMLFGKDISPTLKDMLNQFSDNDSTDVLSDVQKEVAGDNEVDDINNNSQGSAFDDYASWNINQDDQISQADDSSSCTNPNFSTHQEESNKYTFHEPLNDDKFEKIAAFLSLDMGLTSRSNAWAGPDYWKFPKVKYPEHSRVLAGESDLATKKTSSRKHDVCDIEFTKFLDREMLDIFSPPRSPRSIMLPLNRDTCQVMLPEDCHYIPDSLVRLFILPTLLCLGRKRGKFSDEPGQQNSYCDPQWDNENPSKDLFDGERVYNDKDDHEPLVCQRPQVNKISVQYDKISMQVDVHALKELLWTHIQESVPMPEMGSEATVNFRHVLHHFPCDRGATEAAVSAKDLSHLFFICLLHLANEHCLNLHGYPSLDDLDITIPLSAVVN